MKEEEGVEGLKCERKEGRNLSERLMKEQEKEGEREGDIERRKTGRKEERG